MGATVTCGKEVYALRTAQGKILYVLFEETYEKNCYPHHARWSCIGIGYLPQALRRIYRLSSATIGGNLQGRSGWISPVNYLKGWMGQLAHPLVMPDQMIDLVCGTGFYDALQTKGDDGQKSADQIREIVRSAGISTGPVDDAITHGSYSAMLSEIGDLVDCLCQHRVCPWRLVQSKPWSGQRDASLGYAPAKAAKVPFNYRYARLKTSAGYGETLLVQDVRTGKWSPEDGCGLAWLENLAVDEELASPGSVVMLLPKHLKASKDALYAGLDTVITLDKPAGAGSRWWAEEYERFVLALGLQGDAVPDSVTITLRDALAAVRHRFIPLHGMLREVDVDGEALLGEGEMKLHCLSLAKVA